MDSIGIALLVLMILASPVLIIVTIVQHSKIRRKNREMQNSGHWLRQNGRISDAEYHQFMVGRLGQPDFMPGRQPGYPPAGIPPAQAGSYYPQQGVPPVYAPQAAPFVPQPDAPQPVAQNTYTAPPPAGSFTAMQPGSVYPAVQSIVPPVVPVKQRQKINTYSVVLGIGVFLVFIAGLIFATSTWSQIGPALRLTLLVVPTLVFFGVAWLARKRLKLPGTSLGLYLLGSLFCFVSVIGAGYFSLLGPWLSLFGAGRDALWGLGFLLTAGCLFLGLFFYKTPFLVWCTAIFGQLSALFFLLQWVEVRAWVVACMAGVALLVLFVLRLRPLQNIKNEALKKHAYLLGLVNFAAVGALCLFSAYLFGLGDIAAVVTELFLLLGFTALAATHTFRAGWYLHPFLLIALYNSLCSLLFAQQEVRMGVFSGLCIASFWLFYLSGRWAKQSLRTLVSDIGFLGIVVLVGLQSLMYIYPQVGIIAFALLAVTLLALCLRRGATQTTWAATGGLPVALFLLYASVNRTVWLHSFEDLAGASFAATVILAALFFAAASLSAVFCSKEQGGRLHLPMVAGMVVCLPAAWIAESALNAGNLVGPFVVLAIAIHGGLCLYLKNKKMPLQLAALGQGIPLVLAECAAVLYLLQRVIWQLALQEAQGSIRLALLAAAALLMLLPTAVRGLLKKQDGKMLAAYGWFTLAASFVLLLWSSLAQLVLDVPANGISYLLIGLNLLFAACLYTRKQMLFVMPSLACLYALALKLVPQGAPGWMGQIPYKHWAALAAFGVLALTGRLLFAKGIWNKTRPMQFDWFTVFAAVPAFAWLSAAEKPVVFVGFLLFACWFALYWGRLPFAHANKAVITASLLCVFAAVWRQPFAQWPAVAETEIAIVLLLAYALVLRFVVWKKTPAGANWFLLASAAGSILVQFVDAQRTAQPFDAIALSALCLFAVGYYCWLRIKRMPLPQGYSRAFGVVAILASQGIGLWQMASFYHNNGVNIFRSGTALPVWCGAMLLGAMLIGALLLHMQKMGLFIAPAAVGVYLFTHGVIHRLVATPQPITAWVFAALFLVFALVGRLLYRNKAVFKERFYPNADVWSIAACITPLYWFGMQQKGWIFAAWLILGAWLLLFYGRLPGRFFNRVLCTGAVACAALAVYLQPFFVWPSWLATEAALLLMLGAVLVLRFAVWKEYADSMGWLLFAATVFAFVVQGAQALWQGLLWDAMVLGIAAVVLLVFSVIIHQRRWFLLSFITVLIIVLYRTADFWRSLAWWIYLLAAGILLIVFAAVNEGYRQKGSNLKKRFSSSKFFTKWKW
ncbi:MAG: hypothetical protein ACK5JF_01405 [Oscillospiraceae bacterium]